MFGIKFKLRMKIGKKEIESIGRNNTLTKKAKGVLKLKNMILSLLTQIIALNKFNKKKDYLIKFFYKNLLIMLQVYWLILLKEQD